MKKNVMLELHRSSEGNEKTIQELKSLMNLIMGDISVKDEPAISRTLVKLSYDPDLIVRRLNRKVGRHKAYLREGNWDIDSYESIEEYFNDHSSRSTCVKLEDLEQRILERGAAQVAKESLKKQEKMDRILLSNLKFKKRLTLFNIITYLGILEIARCIRTL